MELRVEWMNMTLGQRWPRLLLAYTTPTSASFKISHTAVIACNVISSKGLRALVWTPFITTQHTSSCIIMMWHHYILLPPLFLLLTPHRLQEISFRQGEKAQEGVLREHFHSRDTRRSSSQAWPEQDLLSPGVAPPLSLFSLTKSYLLHTDIIRMVSWPSSKKAEKELEEQDTTEVGLYTYERYEEKMDEKSPFIMSRGK